MAQQVKNDKGFLVIKATFREFATLGWGVTEEICVCDLCGNTIYKGDTCYYIAVLNQIMDEKCYNEWLIYANRYPEDIVIEQKNFNYCKENLLKIKAWKEE